MSNFSENLRRIRFEKGLTQEEFAALLGTSKQNISRYEAGTVSPLIKTAAGIAEKLGVSLAELNAEPKQTGKFLPSNIHSLSDLHHQRVPLIGKVAAGQPIMAEEEYDTFVEASIKCDCALEVQGESMLPTYLPGDIVYIRHQQTVNDGQIAVVLIDDEATLKHVYRDNNGLTLISDNPAFRPIRIEGNEHDYIAIYGIPVGYTRMYKKNKSSNTAE